MSAGPDRKRGLAFAALDLASHERMRAMLEPEFEKLRAHVERARQVDANNAAVEESLAVLGE